MLTEVVLNHTIIHTHNFRFEIDVGLGVAIISST
jgi:hypothetical protein